MRLSMMPLPFLLLLVAIPQSLPAEESIDPPAPDPLDQPYVALLEILVDHVGEGRIEEAVTFLEEQTSKGVPEGNRDSLKRMLSLVYGAAGKYDGCEVVAVVPVSTRLHRTYAIGYHQRQPLIYTFTMYHFENEWKIQHVTWNDKIGELSDLVERIRR